MSRSVSLRRWSARYNIIRRKISQHKCSPPQLDSRYGNDACMETRRNYALSVESHSMSISRELWQMHIWKDTKKRVMMSCNESLSLTHTHIHTIHTHTHTHTHKACSLTEESYLFLKLCISARISHALSVASSMSLFRDSMWALYSCRDIHMASCHKKYRG